MNTKISIGERLVYLLEVVIFTIGITLLQQITIFPLQGSLMSDNNALKIFCTLISVFFLSVFIYFSYKEYMKNVFIKNEMSIKNVFILLGFGIICVIIIQYITVFFQNVHILTDTKNQDAAISLLKSNPIGFYIVVCLGGPISEELIFRGLLINKLVEKFGSSIFSLTFSVLLSSAMFAFMHSPGNIINSLPFLLVGILLSCVYIKTNKIIISIVLHVVLNVTALF